MQTSFGANLVRAECSDVGAARAVALFDREIFFRPRFSNFVAYLKSDSLCAATYSSNLMIAFSHHCDRTFFIDTGQK